MGRSRVSRHRNALLVVIGAAVVAGLALLLTSPGKPEPAPATGEGTATRTESLASRFAGLSRAHTNRCDLGAAELQSMPDGMRLQGSCCFPMDRAGYGQQVRGLHRYAGDRLVPSDPYDVPVTLAKRLLGYRQIALSASQSALYRQASAKSALGGPCCCQCWRWQAFKGQARFVIARRHYSAAEVARLWELEEGCGGSET